MIERPQTTPHTGPHITPEVRPEGFQWSRSARFGGGPRPPSRRDQDTPQLWLTRVSAAPSKQGSLLFLVNDTGEVLRKVSVEGFGVAAFDDEVCALGGPWLVYTDVPPGAAVKVDAYDDFYDLDYSIGLTVTVAGANFDERTFIVSPKKGGCVEEVLCWRSAPDT